MNTRHALLPSAALLAVGLIVPASATSAAPLVTRCDGEASDVTIPGDLVVPSGASCELTRTTVQGSVSVRRGADLVLLDGSSVSGDLTVASDGFAEVIGSSVAGSVIGRDPFSIIIDSTDVGGDLNVRANEGTFDATVYTVDALVNGAVAARGSEVFIESSTVLGDVDTRTGVLTDVLDSTVFGSLRVRGSELGSIICASEIDGDAVFVDNSYGLQIGGSSEFGSCDGDSYWGGAVAIADNTGEVIGIDVSDNIVRGDLGGDGNDPAPTGSGNRVRGEVSGQFVDLQPATGGGEVARAATPEDTAPDRRIDADGRIDARRAAAAQRSTAAGAAFG